MTAGNKGARPIEEARNVGPRSAMWLRAVGVSTITQLDEIGAVAAYQRVREAGFSPSLNLLWALAGAQFDLPWNALPPDLRDELTRELQHG